MKKELRKVTAFASAVILASQCMTIIGAEEAKDEKADISEQLHASIIKNDSLYDKNKDGVISQKELEEIFSLTLDGSIITEIDSLKDLSKLDNLNHISIINWKNFNPVLLCDVKQVTYIQLTDSTFAECSEKVDHINHIDIFNT
ncbi:MAG: hypothetical protein IKH71_03540, partial [Oscillospiraceae bacterium]|nr:hypothetical protein [Oscillospiraceae bacterium]